MLVCGMNYLLPNFIMTKTLVKKIEENLLGSNKKDVSVKITKISSSCPVPSFATGYRDVRIWRTDNYNAFGKCVGNRKTSPAKVKKIARAMERGDLHQFYPVLINEKCEIIDGQHTLEARKLRGEEVEFQIGVGLTIQDVANRNSAQNSWNPKNHVENYIKQGNNNYQILEDVVKENGLGYLMTANMLYFGRPTEGGNEKVKNLVEEGDFVVKKSTLNKVKSFLNKIKDFKNAGVDGNLVTSRTFMNAVAMFYDLNKTPDHKTMVNKIKKGANTSTFKVIKRHTKEEYLLDLVKIYNRNQRKANKVSAMQNG